MEAMTKSVDLAVIADLRLAAEAGLPVTRRQIAPPIGATRHVPLIPGTERFAGAWLPIFHVKQRGWIRHDVAVYSLMHARVSGDGWIWLEDRLVTSPEVMPEYVAEQLHIARGGHPQLHCASSLPVRSIETPCLVAVGHGTSVYGHFLVEMLFCILVTRAAFRDTELRYHLLLDRAAPDWLLRILIDHLRIPPDHIAFFDPKIEQVWLRHAIVPSLLLQKGGFHPVANDMLASMVAEMSFQEVTPTPKRLFVARRGFSNPASTHRRCLNEEALIAIAARRHGFTPVNLESMAWPQQIAAFRDAEITLGLAGSGLHNALFSAPESALASIGVMNFVQSEIGHLRRQHNAFLDGIPITGDFAVDEAQFTAFLDAVCDSWPLPQPPPVLW
jgi:capsular polysaccharide biosynthesis protein